MKDVDRKTAWAHWDSSGMPKRLNHNLPTWIQHNGYRLMVGAKCDDASTCRMFGPARHTPESSNLQSPVIWPTYGSFWKLKGNHWCSNTDHDQLMCQYRAIVSWRRHYLVWDLSQLDHDNYRLLSGHATFARTIPGRFRAPGHIQWSIPK